MIPLLTDWTEEDRAAKGLRRGPAARTTPVHRTALELAAEAPLLLLLAPPGGGCTTMLHHVARFAAGAPPDPTPVVRNEEGLAKPEAWEAPAATPVFWTPGLALESLPPGALLLVDDADDPALPDAIAARPGLRALLVADPEVAGGWVLPQGFRRHRLLPLLAAQRAHLPEALRAPLFALPGYLAIAQRLGVTATSAPVLRDTLLVRATPAEADLLDAGFMRPLLEARMLENASPAMLALRFLEDEAGMPAVLRHVVAADPAIAAPLAACLVRTGDAGALLAAEIEPGAVPGLVEALRAIVEGGRLGVPQRARAGRELARRGDPRDLAELVDVPGGEVVMGSALAAPSRPVHRVAVGAFRIGRYPVVNALYARFVAATGRAWVSPARDDPALANAPATDLTWRDAVACCAWLTETWRAEGRIGASDVVRLPSEPEWEWAARGSQGESDAPVHPWAAPWDGDRCNGDSAGLNAPCAVGLFPRGRSPWGVDDMAGQVWEWCHTLWGPEMALPSFAYPWRGDDGREEAEAPRDWRRVLRGGCFSSPAEKANAHYRGSLEPDGFWRGNGFRVVVG
ncbi:formylglycine-generating enzyme family protein [Falsiroseomonas ponticola]|uniref:formylglycine-generating enzyme family protein n=1 Tax=Falsiroseomonas ponticola TaxID=2786951 RepID=UPI001931A219|nr:formylglycine-generating enzyme family protein [Roseomonas ponticola]